MIPGNNLICVNQSITSPIKGSSWLDEQET